MKARSSAAAPEALREVWAWKDSVYRVFGSYASGRATADSDLDYGFRSGT